MEDIIRALLDVVRVQHAETDGTEVEPFNMSDVVDMALNLVGKPDEPEEEAELVKTIEDTVYRLEPELFPPKTFAEMDEDEVVATAASMIQEKLFGGADTIAAADVRNDDSVRGPETMDSVDVQGQMDGYSRLSEEDDGEEEFDAAEASDLNNVIYNQFMRMMGLQDPQVEFPFDRSQIQYGKEKTMTEMLEEEAAQKATEEEPRQLSAWELAQAAVDQDEALHAKEEYIPKPMEMPETKSASQIAAEAIAQAREQDQEKSEVEKRAEALMEEARRLGKDPMQFALHQQEILRYMEKNSDELVSFEDYEDLSPEEKLEIERRMEEEKRLEREAAEKEAPQADAESVPEEEAPAAEAAAAAEIPAQEEENGQMQFTEEMLRQMSAEVLREHSDMILSENADEDMESLNQTIMENIMKMMGSKGVPSEQESVDSLLDQVSIRHGGGSGEPAEPAAEEEVPAAAAADVEEAAEPSREEETVTEEPAAEPEADSEPEPELEPEPEPEEEEAPAEKAEEAVEEEPAAEPEPAPQPVMMSAEELARAAQRQAGIKVQERQEQAGTISAADLARAAQEAERKRKEEARLSADTGLADDDLNFDDLDDDLGDDAGDEADAAPDLDLTDDLISDDDLLSGEDTEEDGTQPDIPVYVLGEHTREEVDEAIANLETLGLEGDVYERAKRLLLLELAGSEGELEAWLKAEEERKASGVEEEKEDPDDLDEESLDRTFEEELDADFENPEEEEAEEETPAAEEAEASPEPADQPAVEEAAVEEPVVEASVEETSGAPSQEEQPVEDQAYKVSVHRPFVLKNSASFMDQFEDFLSQSKGNRRLSTGFPKLDAMLRYGLHKGSWFIDSSPQYLRNAFVLQIADRAAEAGVDVLYISTELSRYDLMVESMSRLTYEIHEKDKEKALSPMDIMTGEGGLEILKDELNWYRGRISEHLYIIDQETVADIVEDLEHASAGNVLVELIRTVVRDADHKPVVVIDNIDNILSVEEAEEMLPLLMEGIRKLAGELNIPILMSRGFAQMENEEELHPADLELQEELGSLCDVWLKLEYADMVTEEGGLSGETVEDIVLRGDTVPVNIHILKNRRRTRTSCQIQGAPKFNYLEE